MPATTTPQRLTLHLPVTFPVLPLEQKALWAHRTTLGWRGRKRQPSELRKPPAEHTA